MKLKYIEHTIVQRSLIRFLLFAPRIFAQYLQILSGLALNLDDTRSSSFNSMKHCRTNSNTIVTYLQIHSDPKNVTNNILYKRGFHSKAARGDIRTCVNICAFVSSISSFLE